ncbi:MAG: sodium:solute symporter family protein [Treponemataceae bacterium]|nr:sodium:solute symporter family protein [Treponemataceae bacterium]
MSWGILFFILFLLINAGFIFFERTSETTERFVLHNRRLGGNSLFFTLLASNLSAFTVFGVSGAAYRIGWAFFPPMATGTALMTLSFVIIGIPLRALAAAHQWKTPGQCIVNRYKSPSLGRIFTLFLLLFTLPYLAVQIGSAGFLIQSVFKLPYWLCSLFFTLLVALYVLRGGMGSIVKTDIFQGLSLFIVGFVAFGVVLYGLLKNPIALGKYLQDVSVFSREGINERLPFSQLVSYYLLWFLADPLFPHFIQRFYSARSDKALLRSMSMYPLAVGIIFFIMTSIGVFGRYLIPGLTTSQSEKIYLLVLEHLAGPQWSALFIIAALAALISTFDSQLLSCASMITEDLFPSSTEKEQIKRYRIVLITIALVGYGISLYPPATLLSFLTGAAFHGYAILAPVLFAAVYWPHIGKEGASVLLGIGITLVLIEQTKIVDLPLPLPIFNFLVQGFTLVCLMASSLVLKRCSPSTKFPRPFAEYRKILSMGGAFVILGIDWWNYGKPSTQWGLLPDWLWYHAILLGIMGLTFFIYSKRTPTLSYKNASEEGESSVPF